MTANTYTTVFGTEIIGRTENALDTLVARISDALKVTRPRYVSAARN